MAKYRKRPRVVEARQWDGGRITAELIIDWMEGAGRYVVDDEHEELHITTLEDGAYGAAKHVASPWDFIIRGLHGEFYACKPDIFWETYEEVEDA